MSPIGYTDRQALRILVRLDRRLARAEDALGAVSAAVTDHAESPHLAQEAVRDVAGRLAQTVARRLRKPLPDEVTRRGLESTIVALGDRIQGGNR